MQLLLIGCVNAELIHKHNSSYSAAMYSYTICLMVHVRTTKTYTKLHIHMCRVYIRIKYASTCEFQNNIYTENIFSWKNAALTAFLCVHCYFVGNEKHQVVEHLYI